MATKVADPIHFMRVTIAARGPESNDVANHIHLLMPVPEKGGVTDAEI